MLPPAPLPAPQINIPLIAGDIDCQSSNALYRFILNQYLTPQQHNYCMHRLLFFCLVPAMVACSKTSSTPEFRVPDEYIGYVRAFETEAAARGQSITINNLIIDYDASLPVSICAKVNTTSTDPGIQKIMYINPNITCWNNPTELETLIFHELGHCILGRMHEQAVLPNGNPKSIMVENNILLYSPCEYPIDGEPCDQGYKRDYYLDELFNPATAVPDWAK